MSGQMNIFTCVHPTAWQEYSQWHHLGDPTIDPVLSYSCTVHLVILAPCQDDAEKVAEPEEKEKDAPKTKGEKLKEPQTTPQQSRSKRWLTWVERERKPWRHLTRLVCTHILLSCFWGSRKQLRMVSLTRQEPVAFHTNDTTMNATWKSNMVKSCQVNLKFPSPKFLRYFSLPHKGNK